MEINKLKAKRVVSSKGTSTVSSKATELIYISKLFQTPNDVYRELELCRTKEKNVVVFGLQAVQKDIDKPFTEFVNANLSIDIKGEFQAFCTKGQKPVVIVKFSNQSLRDQVLNGASKLYKSSDETVRKVFINHDLTTI